MLRSSLAADGQRCTGASRTTPPCRSCDPRWPWTASAADHRDLRPHPHSVAILAGRGRPALLIRMNRGAVPQLWLRSSLAADGQRCPWQRAVARRRRRCDPRWPRTASAAGELDRLASPEARLRSSLAADGQRCGATACPPWFRQQLRSSLAADGQRCVFSVTDVCSVSTLRSSLAADGQRCAAVSASTLLYFTLRSSLAADGQRCGRRQSSRAGARESCDPRWPRTASAAGDRARGVDHVLRVAILAGRGRPALLSDSPDPTDPVKVAILAGRGRPALPYQSAVTVMPLKLRSSLAADGQRCNNRTRYP